MNYSINHKSNLKCVVIGGGNEVSNQTKKNNSVKLGKAEIERFTADATSRWLDPFRLTFSHFAAMKSVTIASSKSERGGR